MRSVLSKRGTTRREFLKKSAAMGGVAAMAGCPLNAPCPNDFPAGEINEEVNIAILGSGFGGAVAAARLTEAGLPVALIERGRRWDITGEANEPFSRTLLPDKRTSWLSNVVNIPALPDAIKIPIQKYIGVIERTQEDGIDVYSGAGYGGGSLVYGGILIAPREDVFNGLFSQELSYEDFVMDYYPRVRSRMSVSPMPDDILATRYWQYARVFEQQAINAGLETVRIPNGTDWDVIRAEIAGDIPASGIAGESLGNNSGLKNSLDRTYLHDAEMTGLLTVHLQTEVQKITSLGKSRYMVNCNTIDEHGCVIGTRNLICNHVFMAMGSVHTTKKLVEARETGALSGLNDGVGQGWGDNGNVYFKRDFVGAPTGRQQGSPPAIGALSTDSMPIATIENAQFPVPIECACLMHLCLGLTEARGNFSIDSETGSARLTWPSSNNDQALAAAQAMADRFNNANGGIISQIIVNGLENDSTIHPVGGATIGEACDLAGRVEGQPNLYVVDGALMPGSGGAVNPALTIAALAEQCLDSLLAEQEWI
jgi:cholesterol oxidase